MLSSVDLMVRFRKVRRSPHTFLTLYYLYLTLFLGACFLLLAVFVHQDFKGPSPWWFLALGFASLPNLLFLARERLANARNRSTSGLVHQLIPYLSVARDWDEMVDLVLQFPKAVVPLSGSSLAICDPAHGACEFLKERSFTGEPLTGQMDLSDFCSINFLTQPQALGFFVSPNSRELQTRETASSCFCLPFVFKGGQVGFLSLYLPAGTVLHSDQIKFLNDLIPVLQLQLEYAYLNHSLAIRSDRIEKEKMQIARYLHDTVAQDIALLRVDVEHLMTHRSFHDQPDLWAQIERIFNMTSRANDQMRSSLADLRGEPTIQLDTALSDFVEEVRGRVNFSIDSQTEGEILYLPVHLQRQILYILREALRNIEKHADASQVVIRSIWFKDRLTIEVCDNGKGFDPVGAIGLKGHYGLKIMQECAKDLSGNLEMISSPGGGSRLCLSIPLAQPIMEPVLSR